MSRRRPGSRHHAALDKRRWERTRKAAFLRDGYRCTKCQKAGKLEAHHEPPLHLQDGGDPYDIDGIRTRCRSCHISERRRPLTLAEKEWADFLLEMLG